MSTSIEKEIRTALSSEHYQQLFQHFGCQNRPLLTQENTYFDTADQTLRQLGCGLRIRIHDDGGEFTLKVPIKKHEKLEITDTFTKAEGYSFLESQTFPLGKVSERLATYGIATTQLKVLGQLKNERYEIRDAQGLWVLDKAYFKAGPSFELEFEYTEKPDAFYTFLEEKNIPFIKLASKMARTLSQ